MLFAAILVAVSTIVLANALIRGWQNDMLDSAVENLTGHVKVLAPGYQADPSIEKSFEVSADWQPALDATRLVGWTSRVVVPAVIMSERDTRGVQLVGINPEDEDAISFLREVEVDGEGLESAADSRVLVGVELARQLNTDVGRRIVLITQGSDGRNRESGYRVAGLYDGEGTAMEKIFVFTGRQTLQGMLDTAAVTELSVRLVGNEDGPAARDTLKAAFEGLEVKTWQELQPQAATLFEFADMVIFIWFSVMMVALAFGLVNTLVTAVMERVKELGMLRAIGMRPRTVIAQVVIESVLIVGVGLGFGLLFGVAYVKLLEDGLDLSQWGEGMEAFGMKAVMIPHLLVSDLVLVSVMSMIFGLVASIYPAWRAVKVKPLEAMRR
jgi:ABC-type lipoprotein release transport system permease subunit